MTLPDPGSTPPGVYAPAPVSREKWWRKVVIQGQPPETRLVMQWNRVLLAAFCFCLAGYLSLVTALWGYYTWYRKIPEIKWVDIAMISRFGRVQAAVGAQYLTTANALWKKNDFRAAILTARAAVHKAPANLDARLFLAGCWLQVGRTDEAIQTLRAGIQFQARDSKLQRTLVDACLSNKRYQDLLKILREEFPAHGVRLLQGSEYFFQLAEIIAVLETSGASEAARVADQYPALSVVPGAAPWLARVDWELNRREVALQRLAVARDREPNDPAIHAAYVDIALRMGRADDARVGARLFLAAFPNLITAQLQFLEAYGSRQGADRAPWMSESLRFFSQYRHTPDALLSLSSLAAVQGWPDLAFLLYQNSLAENLTGFPLVFFYVGSLLKAGDFVEADQVWHELAIHSAEQAASFPHLAAMVAWGTGRESEALQIIGQLRRETEKDQLRRRNLGQLFRAYGFPKIADELLRETGPAMNPPAAGKE